MKKYTQSKTVFHYKNVIEIKTLLVFTRGQLKLNETFHSKGYSWLEYASSPGLVETVMVASLH